MALIPPKFKKACHPQHGLCLISDRHESIKSVYSRHNSGWMTQNFCACVLHSTLCKELHKEVQEQCHKKTNYQYG